METRALVVEFVGHKGVGKSTLARRVAETLRERGAVCNQVEPLLRPTRLALRVRGFLCAIRALCCTVPFRPSCSLHELIEWCRRYAVFRQRTEQARRGHGICLLDEGILQWIAALHIVVRRKDMMALFGSFLRQMPDLVVVVEASPEIIEQRRLLRGRPKDLSRLPVSATAADALGRLKDILLPLATTGSTTSVIVVANEGAAPADTAARIATVVLDRYRSRHVGPGGPAAQPTDNPLNLS